MIDYLYGLEYLLIPWVEERIEGMVFDKDAKAIGAARAWEILACVVFDEFTRVGCQMAIASNGHKRWLTREYIVRTFCYPFVQCGLGRVGSLVSVENSQAIKLNQWMGFSQEGIIRQAGVHGEDMIAFGMLRDECRFLPKE